MGSCYSLAITNVAILRVKIKIYSIILIFFGETKYEQATSDILKIT